MAPINVNDILQRANLRPTLLIGLGGSGQKVLVQIKARFKRNYGEVPRTVRFLALDTDQTAEKTQIDDEVITLTADTELINMGGIETANILGNLERYPAIASWIMEDKERVPMRAISMGAQQVRLLGRLAFFWKIEGVASRIGDAVRALTHLEEAQNEQRGLNVFIISSVCGGTGSGSIMDVAYLTRHVIERSGLQSSFCFINGILMLPSVFPNVNKIGIESNAYATLREMDYFYEALDWKMDYGNPRVSVVQFKGQRPFNICYLVDARNERGQGLSGMEEVAPMIAEAIYLQVSSQVGRANDSAFDNVRVLGLHVEDKDEGRYRPTAYSSLGTASLVFPARKIIEVCAHELGCDLLKKELLKKEVDAARVAATVVSFMQSNQLERESLLQQVSRDAKGVLIRINLQPQVLDKFKDNELMSATQQYLVREDGRLDNEYNVVLENNRKAGADILSAKLAEEVNRLVDDPAYGLQYTIAFLEALDKALAAERADFDKEKNEIEARRDKAQQNLRTTQQTLADSFRSSFIGRGGRIKEARNQHVTMFQNYLTARFESRKRETSITLLAGLSTAIQSRRAVIQSTFDRLQFVQDQYVAFTERFTGGKKRDFILAVEITDDSDIQRYYKEHYMRLGTAPAAALLSQAGPLHAWLEMDQTEISDRILSYARGFFDDINQITVEQIILEKKGEVEPQKRLQDLINRSVPFWMFTTEGKLGQEWESEKIVVIGVPDRERSIYKEFTIDVGTAIFTSTFDPHQITVLQTKHGVPLFALTQYKDFKQSHDHVMRTNLKPLYVFPEVRPGGEKAKQVFALGVAYGFVFKSGPYYYVVPNDPGLPPTRMEQGMSASLNFFRNNEEMIEYVKKQVDNQIEQEGLTTAIATLEGFLNDPFVYELKGGAIKTNKIERGSMSKDNSVGRPGSVNFDLIQEMRNVIRAYIDKVLRG